MISKKLNLFFVALFSLTFLLSSSDSYSTIHEVNVRNNFFTPLNFNVNVGDTVKWIWQQGNHTTTCNGSTFTSLPIGADEWNAPMNLSNTTFTYVVTVPGTYNYKCQFHAGSGMVAAFTAMNPVIAVNLRFNYEGFYNGTSSIADTVKVYLHNPASPYSILDSAKKNVTSAGIVLISFPNAGTGNYYIDIRHRNALQTWSQSPVGFTLGSNSSYDFTSAQSQAFGNNQKFKINRWCLYSGDANQDGFIDVSDLSLIDNDVFNIVTGYVKTDVNGDNVVDLTDASITDNNGFNFVGVIKP